MLLESLENPHQDPQESLQEPEGILRESKAYLQGIIKTLRESFANSEQIHHESLMVLREPQQIHKGRQESLEMPGGSLNFLWEFLKIPYRIHDESCRILREISRHPSQIHMES